MKHLIIPAVPHASSLAVLPGACCRVWGEAVTSPEPIRPITYLMLHRGKLNSLLRKGSSEAVLRHYVSPSRKRCC